MNVLASGCLRKMSAKPNSVVSYELVAGDHNINLSTFLGKQIRLTSKGAIYCLNCGKKTNKSFQQGHCYRCFTKLASCDRCIMSPELCHFKQGTCREPEWAEQHCMQEHIVYLANSSGLKVGITRHTQVPTRWIDQGAIQAIPMYSVSTRHLSGLIEVILKEWVADKTNWRKMLKHDVEWIDLTLERDRLNTLAAEKLEELECLYPGQISFLSESEEWRFDYPSIQWPDKIKTFNLDKDPVVEGVLQAIKGQYLILDTGCLNVRKYTSYEVDFEA